ncbi:peptide-methionine (S)-S-oxide reductase MsrA [Candidatus Roizmanbacteria bacterium]|nr:MAG: peptide-methionine (S)-S-oxide reductase MsrA [Candidatus Roizmanbacteria bacterium]
MTPKIILGMGCFWCTEAIYQQLKGITKVTSGYAGGQKVNPTYEQVCTGETGHAEVSQIEFNPEEISLENILYVFWRMHDPTTRNRQGADVGSQYRSIILYSSDEQKQIAEKSMKEAQSLYPDQIVTEIKPLETFYPAEQYHQNYYKDNREYPYCRYVIDPKIEKLKKIQSTR